MTTDKQGRLNSSSSRISCEYLMKTCARLILMFPVSAPDSMSVGKWKEEVYNERKNNRFKGYDAADLTLWKVRPLYSLHRPMC